jgi:hypothetical protein
MEMMPNCNCDPHVETCDVCLPPKPALARQEGGGHYKAMKIQPVEFIHANGVGYLEGNVIKYISRHKSKGKAEDVRKAIHYCELLLQLEYGPDK